MIYKIEKYIINYFRYHLFKKLCGAQMENERKFNKRAFLAVGMFISFIGLPVSGYMNHILGSTDMSVEKHLWMSIHNVLATFFCIFSIWHIKLNWKPVKNAFKKMTDIIISREALYAFALVGVFLTLFILHAVHLNR